MGSPDSDSEAEGIEKPQHEVELDGFWLGRYPVTNEEYRKYKANHNSGDDFNAPRQPVIMVRWKDAKDYAEWLSKKTGYNFCLPTEAQWEYACRAGTQTKRYWGDGSDCSRANYDNGVRLDEGVVRVAGGTSKVGSYAPNEYGLYDMAGNVAEWTRNAYDESAYRFTHDLNPDYQYYAHPDDPVALKRKVVRGGSWKDVAYYMQTGTRTFEYQDTAKSYIGFRNVRHYLGRHRADGGSHSQVY